MHDVLAFLAEGAPWSILGVCLIVGGILLVAVERTWAYTDRYVATRRRPRKLKPWHVEPTGEQGVITRHVPRHSYAGEPGQETRRLMPVTNTARARVSTTESNGDDHAGQPTQEHHAGTAGRVREAQGQGHVEEEGGADRERGQDEGGPVADGEEGSANAGAPEVAQWFHVLVTDEYVLLTPDRTILDRVSCEAWYYDRGKVARDLLVQGKPMIPDYVPPFVSKAAWQR